MAIQTFDPQYILIPKKQEVQFTHRVFDNYMNCSTFRSDRLTSEIDICDEMVDAFNSITSLDIFEDEHLFRNFEPADPMTKLIERHLSNNDHLTIFARDVVTAFETAKVSYYLQVDGSYHNLPAVSIW